MVTIDISNGRKIKLEKDVTSKFNHIEEEYEISLFKDDWNVVLSKLSEKDISNLISALHYLRGVI